MLKKLIKYDFKALNRYLLLIHAFLLAAAAAVRIFLTEPLRIGDSRSVIVSTFGIILFVLIAVGISFATSPVSYTHLFLLFASISFFNNPSIYASSILLKDVNTSALIAISIFSSFSILFLVKFLYFYISQFFEILYDSAMIIVHMSVNL